MILIADDSRFMRSYLKKILLQSGFSDFIEASSGDEAIFKYVRQRPSIVFLDITMPVMDGLSVLEQVMAIDNNAQVVMCSSLATKNNVREALKLGAKDFIVKPYFLKVPEVVNKLQYFKTSVSYS